MLFMTLSSSLVGFQPGWDLPPPLQHADLQPEETLAGGRWGMQLPASPLPCKVLSCFLQHRLPGLARAAGEGMQMPPHVLQLDPLRPTPPGALGTGRAADPALGCLGVCCLRWDAATAAGSPGHSSTRTVTRSSASLQLEPTSRPMVRGPSFGALEGHGAW